MASVGWIFFSKEHREKVGTILDLLRPEGMVDELGIGVIRDVFANQMFPGINTIQTRAKYFFIVSYILWELQNKTTLLKNRSASKYLDDREHEIMWKLGDKYREIKGSGVIGVSKRKNTRDSRLMRRPSAIYWSGLTRLGFMNNRGLGVDSFLKNNAVSSIESLISKIAVADDEQGDDASADFENRLGLNVRLLEKDWEAKESIELTYHEADIFQHKIIDHCSGLLIAELLENHALYEVFELGANFKEFARKSIGISMPEEIKKQIILAHDFSEVMFGAHIAYNAWVQFAKYKNWDEIQEIDEWDVWIKGLKDNLIDEATFDMSNIIQNESLRNAKGFTKIFVMQWWELVKKGLCTLEETKMLIETQEYNNKRYKSRLQSEKLDDVIQNKWIGFGQLDYRFRQTQKILDDIKTGLKI